MRRLLRWFAASLVSVPLASAEEDERPPVPEPLFTETVTDIDGHEPGEFELGASATSWRALHGGGHEVQTTVEGEWLVSRHLGIRGEPFFIHSGENADKPNTFGISLGASWKLVRDLRHDFYLQGEASGRVPLTASAIVEPGESTLPTALDLRAALRRGRWTLRGGVGVEGFGTAFYAPVRASLGVFQPLGPSERFGFFGVEVDADAGRRAPFVVALNLVPNLTSLRLPFKLGFAIPWAIGVREGEPALGLFVRLFIESEREIEYGRRSHPE